MLLVIEVKNANRLTVSVRASENVEKDEVNKGVLSGREGTR